MSFSNGFSSGFGTYVATIKYWIAASAQDASNHDHWSYSSGGPNDATAPIAGDSVVFDANGLGDCNFNLLQVNNFTMAGYTGTVDLPASFSFTGNWNKSSGTINYGVSQINLINTVAAQTITNTAVEVFYKLRIAKSVQDTFIATSKIQVSNRLIIDNNATQNNAQLSGTIELIDDAILEQNGNLYDNGLLGLVSFAGDDHEWIQNNTSSNAQMPAWSVDCTSLTLTEGTAGNLFGFWKLTTISGDIVNLENVHVKNSQAFTHLTFDLFEDIALGRLTWAAGNFDLFINNARKVTVNGDTDISGVTSGTQFFGVGSTLELKGDYSQEGPNGNISTCRVLFSGAGDQTVTYATGGTKIPTNLLEMDKPSGKLIIPLLKQDFAGDSILLTNGEIDIAGDIQELSGRNLTVESGVVVNLSGNIDFDLAANINFKAGSILNSSGNLNFPNNTSSIIMAGTVNAGIGGTTFNFVNPDNTSRIKLFTLADGCVCVSGLTTCYTDTLQGPSSGLATIRGFADFNIQDAIVNPDNLIVDSVIAGTVEYTIGFNVLLSKDYGNCVISFTDDIIGSTITGVDDFHCHALHVFEISQNSDVPVQFIGSMNAVIDDTIEIGHIITRGGSFTWNSSGVLTVGGIKVNDHGVGRITKFIIGALAGNIDIGPQGLIMDAPSELDFGLAPSMTISCEGDVLCPVGVSSNWGAVELEIDGGVNQSLTFGGASEPVVIKNKNIGAKTIFTDGPLNGAVDIHTDATLGNTEIEFPTGLPLAINSFLSIGAGAFKNVVKSDTPAVQFEMTLGVQNPIISEYIDISDSRFLAFLLVINTDTSIDVSNNYYNVAVPEGLLAEQAQRILDGGSVIGNGLGYSEVIIGGIFRSKLLQANGVNHSEFELNIFAKPELIQPNGSSESTFKDLTMNFSNVVLVQPNGQGETSIGNIGATFFDVFLHQPNGSIESEVKDCVVFAEEETALDRKMVPLAFKLIKKFGKTAEFTAFTGEAYDPLVGETTAVAHAVYRWKIVPPFPVKKSFSVENTGEVGKLISYVAAKDIPFIPEIGMDVQIDCERWTIDAVGPIRSGAKIAIYELSMRQ